MANVVDSRIVEMKFNNSQFESGVQQTLNTLAKLKESLNFEGAVKGLSELGSAAKNLTFDAIGSAVDSATSKFSALQEIAVGALRRIGEEAANAALKLVDFGKSLSIDQIANGFDKYAQKTSSVQTIMAATADQFNDTGEQMEYVNEQLDKLNWFTDETSYNFLDMVSSIGKFTSNGIELEKAVTAMQGISNWAAISGQSKNEASRAMYNLSQALAVGEVKLMDWRSIENANMATKEFKEKVLEAAAANGKLKKEAEGVYKTIGKGTKVTIENFSNALSEGWFDSGTLMDVLDEYGNVTDKLYDLSTQTGATATDILTLVEAQQKGKLSTAQLADVLGDSATPTAIANLRKGIEELASAENEFGIKTFRAAQEAKTFEEAVGSVEDAVSTGWMQSFELIFGDYEKARVLWTDVANNMWDIFNGGAEARNELLKDWASSGWEKLEKKIRSTGVSIDDFEEKVKNALLSDSGGAYSNLGEILDEFGSIGAAVEAGAIAAGDAKAAVKEAINGILKGSGSLESVEDKLKEVQKVVSEVWRGDLGNGADRKKAVEALGLDYDMIQNLVNKGAEYQVQLSDLTDEQLKAIGLGEEEIELLRSILDDEDLLSKLGQKGGRELFGEAINQGLVDIVQTMELVKSTWSEVVGSLEAGTLRDWTERLRDWTQNIALYAENEEGVEVLTERGSIFKQMLEKVMTAAKNTFSIIQNGVRLFGELASSASPAIDAINRLGEAFLKLYNAGSGKFAEFLSGLDFSERLTPIAERAAGIIDGITEKIDNFRKSVQGLGDIEGELKQLSEGGGVDLLHRPVVDAKEALKAWGEVGDEIATLYSSTYSNEDGTLAANFTPIIVDKDGNYVTTFTPEHLQKYAENVINGVHDDYLHLQIGAMFEGDDAIRRAEEAAQYAHELHDEYYQTNEETERLKKTMIDINTMGQSISSIFETLANSAMDIAEAFAPIGEALSNLGLVSLDKLAEGMPELAKMAENIRKAFRPLADTIGKDLAKGIDWFSTVISKIDMNKVFGTLSQTFANLVPIATNFWTILTNIGSTIGTVFEAFAPVLEPLSSIFNKLLGYAGDLSGGLADLSGGLATGLKPVIETLGSAVTTVFDTIDKLLGGAKLKDIFKPITEALTKAGETSGGLGEKFKTFFHELSEGNGISEKFGETWDKIKEKFQKVKDVLDPVFKSIKDNLKPIKENLDEFWESVKEGFNFEDAKTMGDYVEKFFAGIGTAASSALKGIVDGLSKIDLGTIFKGITAAKVVNKLLYFKTMISDIMSTLGDGVEEFGTNLYDWIFGDFSVEQLADVILKVAGALGILTLALIALSLIPEDNLNRAISSLTDALFNFLGVITIFYETISKTGGSMFQLQMMGTAMLEAAAAVLILAGALAAFSYISEHMDETGGLKAMAASLAIVATGLILLGNAVGGLKSIGIAASLMIASAALIVLAGALAAFSLVVREFQTELPTALQTMALSLGMLTLALMMLSTTAVGALVGAAALLVAAVAITALAGAIAVWALVVQNFDVAAALLAMAAAFLVVGAAMAAFGSGVGVILAGALALAGASVAIALFSAALAAFLLVLQLAEPALTALSNGFSALGTGLQELLTGLGEGLMAFIAGIGAGIGEAIGGLFAGIGEGIGTGIAGIGTGIAMAEEAIGAGFESMSNKIGESTEAAGAKINTGLTSISEGIGKIGESFSGIAAGISDIGTALGTFSTNVSGLGLIDMITIGAGLKSVADGIKKLNDNPFVDNSAAVVSYVTALSDLSSVTTTLTSTGETMKSLAGSIAQGIMQNLTSGIQNGVSQVNAAFNGMASTMRASLRALPAEFTQIGYQIAMGLAQGIRNGQSSVVSAAQSVASAAKQAAESTLVINSPSKVFAEIGQYMALGMAKGLEDNEGTVVTASEMLAQDAISSANSEMEKFNELFNSDEFNPTITPILDLESAMDGASQLSSAMRGLKLDGSLSSYGIDADKIDIGARSMNVVPEMQNVKGYLESLRDLTNLSITTQGTNPIDVKINFNGSLAQLAAILQPVITAETSRIGKSLINT